MGPDTQTLAGSEEHFLQRRWDKTGGLRRDGSRGDIGTRDRAHLAETYAAHLFFRNPSLEELTGGDGGDDFCIRGQRVDVKWISWRGEHPTLKVNPYKPLADLYVLARDAPAGGFEILGWTTRQRVVGSRLVDWGYGRKYSVDAAELRPISGLLRWAERGRSKQLALPL